MTLTVGIQHLRDGVEPQYVIGAEMSVIGIVGTAPAADAGSFPLSEAIELKTNDAALRTALGATGTLPQALAAISSQVSGSARAARTVIVRVEEGADAFDTIANLIGSEAGKTGIWALLEAPSELGVTPRLIIVPGYTSQAEQGLGEVTISAPGTDGTDGTFALAFTGGTGAGAVGTFTVTGGAVTAVTITDPGVYSVVPTLDFTASAGLTAPTATVALTQLANGVCAAIPTVLERLQASFLPEGPTSTRQAWLDWMETLPASARIFHPLRQDAKALDSEGAVVTRPLSPYIIGKYASRDYERDGVPSGSIANQNIYGLVGVTPTIGFSLTDETSQGQIDLAAHAGIVFRGESGVDDALGASGFIFWGTDTMSAETEWLFTHVNRMRDYIELGQVRALRVYLGKFNITVQTIEAVMNTIRGDLSKLAINGHVLSPFTVEFEPDQNSPAELRNGDIDISFRVEEPPVLRKMILRSRRYAAALEALTQAISVRIGTGISE